MATPNFQEQIRIEYEFEREIEMPLIRHGFFTRKENVSVGRFEDRDLNFEKIDQSLIFTTRRVINEVFEDGFFTRIIRDPKESILKRFLRNETVGLIRDSVTLKPLGLHHGDVVELNVVGLAENVVRIVIKKVNWI